MTQTGGTGSRQSSTGARPIGRILRFVVGVLLIVSVAPIWLRGSRGFNLRTLGVVGMLIVFYVLVHFLVSKYVPGLDRGLGAILALAPAILVYVLGMGGWLIFGAGEGQLAALTFIGVSLLVAGVRGDLGCEVMSIPGLVLGEQTHLACVIFSPVDWLEEKTQARK